MSYKERIGYLVAMLLSGILFIIPSEVSASGLGYAVKAVIPENQIDQKQTYFDLLMKPGETQKIQLEVVSSSNEELFLEITPNIATTNQNGELEYSISPENLDSTLKKPITKLLSGKQSVILKPKETKIVTFQLTMPEESFRGKIVGAFNISEREADQIKKSQQDSDVQINNIMSLGIGIQLRQSEVAVKPDLKLNRVRANLFNYRTAITANIQNTEAEFLGDLKIIAKVKKEGSQKILYETEKIEQSMAPNSNFDFVIPLENQEIKKGNYTLELKASSKDENWQFTKHFRVTSQDANRLNSEAVELEEASTNWLLICQILFFVVLLIVVSVMAVKYYQGRKKVT